MVKELMKEAEGNMKKSIEVVQREFASLRAGRATPALLDKIMVNYYGTPTPVNQLAKRHAENIG
jgi:ribosome recycling factor